MPLMLAKDFSSCNNDDRGDDNENNEDDEDVEDQLAWMPQLQHI